MAVNRFFQLKHIQDSVESVVTLIQKSINGCGDAYRVRGGQEKQTGRKKSDAQGDAVHLSFSAHFIIAEETESDGRAENHDHAGKRKYTEQKIGHDKGDEKNR